VTGLRHGYESRRYVGQNQRGQRCRGEHAPGHARVLDHERVREAAQSNPGDGDRFLSLSGFGRDLFRRDRARASGLEGNNNVLLATAVTIAYLSPIFTTLIGVFLLGEHVRPKQWLFYAIAFAGVLVIKGFDSSVPLLYLFTGLVSAIGSGVAYNLVRRLKEREHPIVVALHFQLIGVVAGFIFTLFNWVKPATAWEWFCLLMCGLLTQFGQTCLTKSLQAERIAHVSILNYTGMIYALVFGIFIFGEHYPAQTIAGIALVVVGVVLSVIYGQRKPLEVIEESELAE
jgi:uncharacterized membrane protein